VYVWRKGVLDWGHDEWPRERDSQSLDAIRPRH
jgi:hypothetical protein